MRNARLVKFLFNLVEQSAAHHGTSAVDNQHFRAMVFLHQLCRPALCAFSEHEFGRAIKIEVVHIAYRL